MKIIVLIGLPGSGKSTWAKSLPGNNKIVSSDHYFTDDDGNYNWTLAEAHKGHEDCLRKFIEVIIYFKSWYNNLIVDNTNVNVLDSSPYIFIAKAYGLEIEVKYIDTDISISKSRNIHNVPEVAYERMQKNLEFLLQNWPKNFPIIEFLKV